MPFVQRIIEPKYLSRTSLFAEDGTPVVTENELVAVTNNTLSNALRQLASLVLVANDIFTELGTQFNESSKRAEKIKKRINLLEECISKFDPKKVSVPEGDICSFATLKEHYKRSHNFDTALFTAKTRPTALNNIYDAAIKTPVHVMRQLDRWRRDGHRSSRFFLCTPVLGKKIRSKVNIEIETHMPSAVQELRRWTSNEAIGDITVTPDCLSRVANSNTMTENDMNLSNVSSIDGVDHKLPSPEEQINAVALKFPAKIVPVDISGKSFDRMSIQRRSFLHKDANCSNDDQNSKRKSKTRKSRNRRRNTITGIDQKEIQDALTSREEAIEVQPEIITNRMDRSRSSDILGTSKKESPDKKSHFNIIKQWGKNKYDRFRNKNADVKPKDDSLFYIDICDTIEGKKGKNMEKRTHIRYPSVSSSEKSINNTPLPPPSPTHIKNVKLRMSTNEKRRRSRSGDFKDEPHSSSGNWSASSESGRASVVSELTITTQPASTTSVTTSNNSLSQPSNSVCSRNRPSEHFNFPESVSEGTLTPDIIHLHEDETSSIYSCDTEGYYTSFHMDSGLKSLKEEEFNCSMLFSSAFSNASINNNNSNNTVMTAENEYELFGRGSTSTTTSSAGTVCTTLFAAESNKSLINGPAVPERKSSLATKHFADGNDKTGTIKRSPANNKPVVIALIHKKTDESMTDNKQNNSNVTLEGSIKTPEQSKIPECEYSETSDMEGSERIRVKTTINSSRIPSMCVITPLQSDDENNTYNPIKYSQVINQNVDGNIPNRDKLDLNLSFNEINDINKNTKIHVMNNNMDKSTLTLVNVNLQSGYATVENVERDFSPESNMPESAIEDIQSSPEKNVPFNAVTGYTKPDTKFLNNMYDPNEDFGEYVTIADVRNNNNNSKTNIYSNINKMPSQNKEVQYVSLNDLPTKDNKKPPASTDSLERKERHGARVTLDAEGKVVYSSDSLNRNKKAHSTFEPGPFVKNVIKPHSPQVSHRNITPVRPIQLSKIQRLANISTVEFNRPQSPYQEKFIVKAASGAKSPAPEIIRMPPATIVTPSNIPMSPKNGPRGAYVHMHESDSVPDPDGGTLPLKTNPEFKMYHNREYKRDDLGYGYDHHSRPVDNFYEEACSYQMRSPDLTRGLTKRQLPKIGQMRQNFKGLSSRNLGTPVEIPKVNFINEPFCYNTIDLPYQTDSINVRESDPNESLKISPIDPRYSNNFKTSTPSGKSTPEINPVYNLENHLLATKKSHMSNEELYAIIHKSKKRMNIETDGLAPTSTVDEVDGKVASNSFGKAENKYKNKSPPSTNVKPGLFENRKQTSRMDFKRLLLQKSGNILGNNKKISAVEQLKLSREQIQTQPAPKNTGMDILNLSGSPRSFGNKKFISPGLQQEKSKSLKIMSPRSQWRFMNPRTDVLSSTILEDCREIENADYSSDQNIDKTTKVDNFKIDAKSTIPPPALETSF